MKDTIKELPKWFNGDVYAEGGTVENPFTGAEYSLDSVELSMYDFIKGLEYVGNHRGWDDEMIKLMHKGLDWFRGANPQAYMALLD